MELKPTMELPKERVALFFFPWTALRRCSVVHFDMTSCFLAFKCAGVLPSCGLARCFLSACHFLKSTVRKDGVKTPSSKVLGTAGFATDCTDQLPWLCQGLNEPDMTLPPALRPTLTL